MMEQIITILSTTILVLISVLHFYWAFGGNWGLEYTVPDKFKDRFTNKDYKIQTTIATLIVAIGLLCFAVVIVSNYYDLSAYLKPGWTRTLTQIIGAIFIIRAIGDFKLFGLFKKSKTSKFEQKDSQIYVPLCLYLGLSSLFISF